MMINGYAPVLEWSHEQNRRLALSLVRNIMRDFKIGLDDINTGMLAMAEEDLASAQAVVDETKAVMGRMKESA